MTMPQDGDFYADGEGPQDGAPAVAVQINNNGANEGGGGAQARRDIPGNEGFYVSGGGQGNVYNAAQEAITFPAGDPGVYMLRAIVPDERTAKRKVNIRSRQMRMYTGFTDPVQLDWYYWCLTAAIGGRARNDFVQIVTGERQVDIANRTGAGMFSGMQNRLLGNQNNRLQGAQ